MIRPDFLQFKRLCGRGNLVPMCMEVPGDLDTPLSALMKIEDPGYSFLLESVEGGSRWARYSFLGSSPRMVIRCKGDRVNITNGSHAADLSGVADPTQVLKQTMARYSAVTAPGLPAFFGGAVGFLSYEVARGFEILPDLGKPGPGFHDALFMITRDMVIFDNLSHRILLTTTVSTDEFPSLKHAYDDGAIRLEKLKVRLAAATPVERQAATSTGQVSFSSNMDKNRFEKMVILAKRYIRAGDIIQAVVSQRFATRRALDPLKVYRGLRMINPSPYMFFLRMGDEVLAGSSPEVMVRLRDGEAIVRPIAGTRPRGSDRAQDEQLSQELLADEKESAEHVMLVDLARNDLGRIAEPGSVSVDTFKAVEKYSHVMHMVSNVRARPATGRDAFDVLRATFPAGTLTGAPKIRAMEIIEELEPEHRGPYGGCVGYFSYTGEMDMGITIRTVMVKGDNYYFQAGAGIVADSVPEREYEETVKKAEAMRRALTFADEFQEASK